MSHAVWRSNLPEYYRSLASVCVTVPDGVVFGIHVDTGADPAFSADSQSSFYAEQVIYACDLHNAGRNRCLYSHYLYQRCIAVRPDDAAALVFCIFADRSACVYAVDYGSKIFL